MQVCFVCIAVFRRNLQIVLHINVVVQRLVIPVFVGNCDLIMVRSGYGIDRVGFRCHSLHLFPDITVIFFFINVVIPGIGQATRIIGCDHRLQLC